MYLVEVYIGWPGYSWSTRTVNVENAANEDHACKEALAIVTAELANRGYEVVFTGIYNVQELEED